MVLDPTVTVCAPSVRGPKERTPTEGRREAACTTRAWVDPGGSLGARAISVAVPRRRTGGGASIWGGLGIDPAAVWARRTPPHTPTAAAAAVRAPPLARRPDKQTDLPLRALVHLVQPKHPRVRLGSSAMNARSELRGGCASRRHRVFVSDDLLALRTVGSRHDASPPSLCARGSAWRATRQAAIPGRLKREPSNTGAPRSYTATATTRKTR